MIIDARCCAVSCIHLSLISVSCDEADCLVKRILLVNSVKLFLGTDDHHYDVKNGTSSKLHDCVVIVLRLEPRIVTHMFAVRYW